MSKIVVVGSSNTDMVIKSEHLPAPGETILGGEFFMNPGGKGANQAVAAARLGGDVVFVAKVGDDIFGQEAVQGFREAGINTDYIATDPEQPSGVATIMVDNQGENCIAVASGANNALRPEDVDNAMEQIEGADVLLMQLETPIETVEYAAKLGHDKGKTVILNPAPAQVLSDELLARLDVITPNETEAEILTGTQVETLEDAQKAAQVLRERDVGTVIITLGAQGAFVLSDSFSGLVPVRKVNVVDTTAAGDTFNGALAVGMARGMDIEAAVAYANKAAAVSVTRMGAQASAPSLDEVEAED
ncbi:ribokinase [Pontiella sulfatireligans]|nr:ribokinase [Pontiella sulfatireligans]